MMDQEMLRNAARELGEADPALGALLDRNGLPPLWRRPAGFATMVLFVLEQQVSLASARAAYRRLEDLIARVAPRPFLELDPDQLRAAGFSRQKAAYCRDLAAGLISGSLMLPDGGHDDDEARALLLAIRGVGPWTADCYLLFALGRPDAWPSGDRALQVSMARALSLDGVPTVAEADVRAEAWRPWRSVAARLLWHDYLGGRQAVGAGSVTSALSSPA